jgi:hypothetical protein
MQVPGTVASAPVLVRNMEKGCSVFTDANTKQAIEWQGHGDRAGEDFQYVPIETVQTPAFLKAMARGIYAVVEADEQTKAALEAQAAHWRKRQDAIDTAARNSTEGRAVDSDLSHVRIDAAGRITTIAQPTGVQTSGSEAREVTIPAEVIIEPSAHRTRQPATQ